MGLGQGNCIKFFGASLDALDTPEAVNIRKSYVEALSSGKHPQSDLRDPYELFRKIMGNQIKEFGHQYLGRFIVDSWLTPKPKVSDLDLIRQENFEYFIMNDGLRVFAELLRDFVKFHVFPDIPGMIGVDHSLTGGVLMALSERFGPENLGVLVLDAHTDAIPLPIRSCLFQYASEAGLSSVGSISKSATLDPYTGGNFLFYLIEKEIILPENLIIVGSGDSADKLRNLSDRRVIEYVRHYDSLLERGVKVITKEELLQFGPAVVQDSLDRLKCSKLYISLDVDVSAYCGVLGARFLDVVGIENSLILETASKVLESFCLHKFLLVGIDIMEIDIYKIGAKLSSGVEDQTEDFIRKFINLFVQGLPFCTVSDKSRENMLVSDAL
jgi:arginase family enzyme